VVVTQFQPRLGLVFPCSHSCSQVREHCLGRGGAEYHHCSQCSPVPGYESSHAVVAMHHLLSLVLACYYSEHWEHWEQPHYWALECSQLCSHTDPRCGNIGNIPRSHRTEESRAARSSITTQGVTLPRRTLYVKGRFLSFKVMRPSLSSCCCTIVQWLPLAGA